MVDLLATQQKAFFCLPKICVGHDIDIPANMQCALTAIQTYQRHIQRGPEASRSGEADIFLGGGSLLDHFLRLWEWTRDFGLHRNEEPVRDDGYRAINWRSRSEEHTSELQSLMRISYAVFCLKKKK